MGSDLIMIMYVRTASYINKKGGLFQNFNDQTIL